MSWACAVASASSVRTRRANRLTILERKIEAALSAGTTARLYTVKIGSISSINGIPTASNTTYNVCGITGSVDPTYEGQYTGGFENLPRFNEKWSSKKATIRGSFARLFTSEFGDNPWKQGNVYSPPIRDYGFDSDLLDPANLPPFTPNVIQTELVSETVTITPKLRGSFH